MEQYGINTANGGYIQLPVCDKNIISELSGDFTLPDYQPEIKRLLRVSASVLPASKYIGDRSMELAGNIDYYVLYTGSDNQVYCAPLTSEYKIEVPIDSTDGMSLSNLTGHAVIIPDTVSGRVTSPRKLSIKCRLRTRARVFGDMLVENDFGAGDDSLEVLYGNTDTSRTILSAGEMLRVSDEIINASPQDELRVICADGKALIDEVTCSDGTVNCRGNLYLKLLMSKEDGSVPISTTRKIPFSQSVASEGVVAGNSACAKATVCEMSVNVDEGRITLDVGMIIEVCASKTEEIQYVKDVYSTSHRVACDYETLDIPRHESSFNGNFTLSDSMTLEDAGISPQSKVIDVTGYVYPDEYSFDGGRCTVGGRVRYDILLERDGEYSNANIELPFKYETNISNSLQDAQKDAAVEGEIISSRARIDGERIGIDSEISIHGNDWEMAETEILDRVNFGEAINRGAGEYTVCYPSMSDSLWSIAKRYGAPLSLVAKTNRIQTDARADSRDSLANVKYLVI